MKILALEFSSSQRSVAVVTAVHVSELQGCQYSSTTEKFGARLTRPSEVVVSEIIETASGKTMKPLNLVEEAMKQAGLEREQVECVAIGLGPGSYTGIRVAIALAQGWQLARGLKLLGISSAECVATQAQAEGFEGKCAIVIDAQREEFYFAAYEMGATGLREVEPLKLATMAELRKREKTGETLIGPEVTRWFTEGRVVFPRAGTLGRLALERQDFVAGEKLEPIYLRETKFVKAPPARIVS